MLEVIKKFKLWQIRLVPQLGIYFKTEYYYMHYIKWFYCWLYRNSNTFWLLFEIRVWVRNYLSCAGFLQHQEWCLYRIWFNGSERHKQDYHIFQNVLNEKCEVKTTNSSWSSISTLDGQEACAKISDSELQIMLQWSMEVLVAHWELDGRTKQSIIPSRIDFFVDLLWILLVVIENSVIGLLYAMNDIIHLWRLANAEN